MHIAQRFPVESPVAVKSSWHGGTTTGVVKGHPSATTLEVEFYVNGSLWRETLSVLKVSDV